MLINTLRSLLTVPFPQRASHQYRAFARFKKLKFRWAVWSVILPKEGEKTGALAAEWEARSISNTGTWQSVSGGLQCHEDEKCSQDTRVSLSLYTISDCKDSLISQNALYENVYIFCHILCGCLQTFSALWHLLKRKRRLFYSYGSGQYFPSLPC